MRIPAISALLFLVVAYANCGGSDEAAMTAAENDDRALVADEYRPVGKFCPTSRICMREVKWSAYNQERAVGTGAAEACELEGGCSRYPGLRITFTRPRQACGTLRFTRLETFGTTFTLRDKTGCREYDVGG
jgi:hypothetical protein